MARQGFTVFWTKEEIEDGALNLMSHLRSKKLFSKVVKDGIALVWDLMNGRVDELLLQFPFVRELICPPTPPPDNSDMEKRIADAVEKRIEDLLNKRSPNGYVPPMENNFPLMQPANQGAPRQIGGGIDIAMPVIEDDEVVEGETVEVKVSHEGGNIAAMAAKVLGMMQVDTNSQEYRNLDTGRRH